MWIALFKATLGTKNKGKINWDRHNKNSSEQKNKFKDSSGIRKKIDYNPMSIHFKNWFLTKMSIILNEIKVLNYEENFWGKF